MAAHSVDIVLVLAAALLVAPAMGCSGVNENCNVTRCCKDDKLECYEKNAEFATCVAECEEGIHPKDPAEWRTPWSCKALMPDSGSLERIKCGVAFDECGGEHFEGAACCLTGCECKEFGRYHSSCQPTVHQHACGKYDYAIKAARKAHKESQSKISKHIGGEETDPSSDDRHIQAGGDGAGTGSDGDGAGSGDDFDVTASDLMSDLDKAFDAFSVVDSKKGDDVDVGGVGRGDVEPETKSGGDRKVHGKSGKEDADEASIDNARKDSDNEDEAGKPGSNEHGTETSGSTHGRLEEKSADAARNHKSEQDTDTKSNEKSANEVSKKNSEKGADEEDEEEAKEDGDGDEDESGGDGEGDASGDVEGDEEEEADEEGEDDVEPGEKVGSKSGTLDVDKLMMTWLRLELSTRFSQWGSSTSTGLAVITAVVAGVAALVVVAGRRRHAITSRHTIVQPEANPAHEALAESSHAE